MSKPGAKPKPKPSARPPQNQSPDPPARHEDSLNDNGLSDRLQSLESEIQSKERTLSLLNDKLSKVPVEAQLEEQLRSRDKYIEELNEKIKGLEKSINPGEMDTLHGKDMQIRRLMEEKGNLVKELKATEERLMKVQSDGPAREAQLREEKKEAEMLQDALTEELESSRAQCGNLEGQLQSCKNDIKQLASIVQELSQLNTELNEKILSMNQDMETKNKEHFTATVKAEHAEELEQLLSSERTENMRQQKKIHNMLEDHSRLQGMDVLNRANLEALRVVEEAAMTVDTPAGKEIQQGIQRVRTEIKKMVPPQSKVRDDQALLKEEIKTLKKQLSIIESEDRLLKTDNSILQDRLNSIHTENEGQRKQLLEANDKQQKRAKGMTETLEHFGVRMEKVNEALKRTEGELQKSQTQVIGLQSHVKMNKERKDETRKTREELENVIKELKSQILHLRQQLHSQETSMNNRELKLRQTATKLKILTDQVSKKETEILRKESQRASLEEELSKLKAGRNHSPIRHAASNPDPLSQLEEKDKTITMLKEMLKSAQTDMKKKEHDISRIKRQRFSALDTSLNATQEEVHSAPDIGPQLAEMEEVALLRESIEAAKGKLPVPALKKVLKQNAAPSDKAGALQALSQKLQAIGAGISTEITAHARTPFNPSPSQFRSKHLSTILSGVSTYGELLAHLQS